MKSQNKRHNYISENVPACKTPFICLTAMDDFVYLTQDFSHNADDGRFHLTLHKDILSMDVMQALNQGVRCEDFRNGRLACFYQPEIAALAFCRCKLGAPTGDLEVTFDSSIGLSVRWPGVTRVFVRVRIMETTTLETMTTMLIDDLEGGHSLSDVDHPEQNQSFRPWSDEEDSESGTFEA